MLVKVTDSRVLEFLAFITVPVRDPMNERLLNNSS